MGVVATLCVLTLISASELTGREGVAHQATLGGIVWLTIGTARGLIGLRRRHRPLLSLLLLEAALVGLTVTAVRADVPFRLRFRLSESAMTRYAEAVIRGEEDPGKPPSRIGLFPIRRIVHKTAPESVAMSIEPLMFGEVGFVFRPSQPSPAADNYRLSNAMDTPIREHWSFWSYDPID